MDLNFKFEELLYRKFEFLTDGAGHGVRSSGYCIFYFIFYFLGTLYKHQNGEHEYLDSLLFSSLSPDTLCSHEWNGTCRV